MRIIGWTFIMCLIGGTAFVTDMVYGRVSEVGLIRQDALNFRNEVAYTLFSTKNIVPKTDHLYRFPFRDEGEEFLKTTEPRRFRSNEVGAVQPVQAEGEDLPIIAFLGGSTTENNEVDEPFRFPGMVAEVLKQDAIKSTTLNFGVRGHTTIDSINVLINRIGNLKADYVVLMHNINDRFRSATDRGYAAMPGTVRMSSADSIANAAQQLMDAVWNYLSYRSNILFTLRFNENVNNAFRDDHGPEKDNAGNIVVPAGGRNKPDSAAFEKNLRVFVAVAKALGIKPILMTQPLGNQDQDHEAFNNIVKKVALTDGVWLIDLSKAFGNEPHWAFLSDDVHFNNAGSIAAAKAIATELAKRIWDKKSVSDRGGSNIVSFREIASRCPYGEGEFNPGKPWYLAGLKGRYPSVSADGEWMLFQERVGSADRIRLVNIATGKVHDIVPEDIGVSERHPAFVETTQESVKIVYGKGAEDNNLDKIEQLVELTWPVMERRVLTPREMSGSIPSVSKDSIVFAGSIGRSPDLYEVAKESGQLNRLTDTEWEEWRPALSPLGYTYFISNETGNFDIYRRGQEGNIDLVWGSTADEWDPAVTSDGNYLAFTSRRSGDWNLYLLRLSGPTHQPLQITFGDSDEWDPSFVDRWRMLIYAKAENLGSQLMGMCLYGE